MSRRTRARCEPSPMLCLLRACSYLRLQRVEVLHSVDDPMPASAELTAELSALRLDTSVLVPVCDCMALTTATSGLSPIASASLTELTSSESPSRERAAVRVAFSEATVDTSGLLSGSIDSSAVRRASSSGDTADAAPPAPLLFVAMTAASTAPCAVTVTLRLFCAFCRAATALCTALTLLTSVLAPVCAVSARTVATSGAARRQ